MLAQRLDRFVMGHALLNGQYKATINQCQKHTNRHWVGGIRISQ